MSEGEGVGSAMMVAVLLALLGTAFFGAAIVFERRMHAYRQPGVGYWAATLRRDGGWRREDLFTPAGLQHQRRASFCGVVGTALWLAALLVGLLFGPLA